MAALDAYVQQAFAALKQGPVESRFDAAGTPVNILSNDGVDIAFARGQAEQVVDLLGVYDLISAGDGLTFELTVPELTYSALKVLMADQLDGTTYIGLGETAGTSARATGLQVEFRPWHLRAAETHKVVLWIAVPEGDATFHLAADGAYTITQGYRALPHTGHGDGNLLGQVTWPARA